MPNTSKGTPYVQSSDLVSAYPTTSLSLANHIDNNLTYNAATFQANTGTSYTFALADASLGKIVTASNAAAQTYTIPPQTSVTWATGAVIRLVNLGAGAVTVVGGAGVTVSNAGASLGQYDSANLIRISSDSWTMVRAGGLPKASYSSTTGSPSVTTVGSQTCVKFTGTGSITIDRAGTVDILVVGAGGGGGGSNASVGGSGGGGGGVLYLPGAYLSATVHTIRVEGGGAVGNANGASNNGGASRCGPYYSPGGGGGAGQQFGLDGGSGGGGGSQGGGTARVGGTGTNGLGNNGGLGAASSTGAGGGGGGSANGAAAVTTAGGAGGAGTTNSIDGTGRVYGSGGGGGGSTAGGAGGTNAGNGTTTTGTAGAANFGGGGGGGGTGSPFGGGQGGSGVVILLFG